jgi:GNAT superfamily N-acetyltransferase
MIRIRVPGDDKDILRLVKKELLPFVHQTFPDMSTNLAELKARLRRGKVYIAGVPATEGKSRVGGFLATVKDEEAVWIDMLAVGKEFQGKGLGSALMQRAESEARSSGCQEANVFVDAVNPKARTFYAKRGYVPVRYVAEVGCYHLRKKLKQSGNRPPGHSYNPFPRKAIV